MTKRNLKIAITPEQPLDEVVRELIRLGFRFGKNTSFYGAKSITAWDFGRFYGAFDLVENINHGDFYTLTELKEME